jgi:aspartate-semialdehyde dehydrogenase
MDRIKVGVLGATGAVGQRFVQLLDGHPWFEVTALTGSDRTVGGAYAEGCRWVLQQEMPEYARGLKVLPTEPGMDAKILFSALPADNAREAEPALAAAGYAVFSNASSHRMWPDVPLLIPEVNHDHIRLVEVQRRQRGWRGFIVTNPNCTSSGLTMALRPLLDTFGVRRVFAVSMQALSGAGYPGVASLDALDNVMPYIGGEEGKVETEPLKMLGKLNASHVEDAPFKISAHTNRVAVSDGHMVCASVEFERAAGAEEAAQAMAEFQSPAPVAALPSAPARPIEVRPEADRPQPRRDRDAGKGMTTVVGRVRPDPLFHVKFVCLSHNTIRGAAGDSLLNAELAVARELIQ